MAPPPGTLRVGRYFAALVALIGVLYLVVFLPGHRHTPKLGIDLVGGREVIFKAHAPNNKAPSAAQLAQAKQIMESRVNGTGVTGATVVVEGADRIDISIPGGTNTDVAALGKAAVLNFRGLITAGVQITCGRPAATPPATGTSTVSPPASPSGKQQSSPAAAGTTKGATASQAVNGVHERPLTPPTSSAAKSSRPGSKAGSSAKASPSSTASGSATGSANASGSAAAPTRCYQDPFSLLLKDKTLNITSVPSSEDEYTALVKRAPNAGQAISAALANYDCSATQNEPDLPNRYYIACDDTGTIVYLLGKIIVPGNQISSASAQAPTTSGQGGLSEWSVQLNLKSKGADSWAAWTGKYNTAGSTSNTVNAQACGASAGGPCSDVVGFTLDGKVITAPTTNSAINHQPTSITGQFKQKSANTLADQLNYGALPLSFDLDENQPISATLGSAQLKAGLLAGGIGLLLVIIYSLMYYRGLGLVTIASLLVSGGLTWAMLVLLGNQIGFTLDLAGIAGFIVAIGITADSFVVFFERIKDEVHEGRSVRVAVPRAWVRARRTILSADTVSFLAAAILYYFAAGDVRGFAFTLGLSTILDLIVVFLFTHPLISVLSRSRAFGSSRFTGLDSVREGGIAPSVPEAPRNKRVAGGRVALDKQAAPVAVLDRDDEVTADASDEDPVTNDRAEDDGDTASTTPPRRRSTPEPGSAAERAAARRARMRGKSDGKGEN